MANWTRLHQDERGLEGIEYLLIAAPVIIAAIGAWRYMGNRIASNVEKTATTVESTVADSLPQNESKKSTVPPPSDEYWCTIKDGVHPQAPPP